MPSGIAAGQAWECEPTIDLGQYQRAKTGVAVRRRDRLPAPPPRVPTAAPGANWAKVWARRTRSPTISPMCCRERRNWANQPARTRPWDDPTPPCDGCRRSHAASGGPGERAAAASIPPCPGSAALKALTMSEARRLLPKDLVAARSLMSGTSCLDAPAAYAPAGRGPDRAQPSGSVSSPGGVDPRQRMKQGSRRVHLADLLFALRNRFLASPRFQRWASSFPLTRPIARRRARALFDLCAGFVYSQVLQACVRLRLFDALNRRPADCRGTELRAVTSARCRHPAAGQRRPRCRWSNGAAADASASACTARRWSAIPASPR